MKARPTLKQTHMLRTTGGSCSRAGLGRGRGLSCPPAVGLAEKLEKPNRKYSKTGKNHQSRRPQEAGPASRQPQDSHPGPLATTALTKAALPDSPGPLLFQEPQTQSRTPRLHATPPHLHPSLEFDLGEPCALSLGSSSAYFNSKRMF